MPHAKSNGVVMETASATQANRAGESVPQRSRLPGRGTVDQMPGDLSARGEIRCFRLELERFEGTRRGFLQI